MNELACRAYRAAILPTFLHSRPSPKFNSKTKPNTNPIAALNYRRAARHPNRLRSPFCTKTRSNTAHQQVHNKSYKWSVSFNVNGGTVIVVRPTYRMTYITSPHRRRTCQAAWHAAYTISKDCVIHCRPRDGRIGSAPPHPASPSLVLSRHGRTDVMAMKDALMHAQRLTRWVAAPQCQPTNADSRRSHIRTTLTTGPAGLPHPATWASLPDTGAWTIARNCLIAQVRYTLYNGAALSAVRFLLIH